VENALKSAESTGYRQRHSPEREITETSKNTKKETTGENKGPVSLKKKRIGRRR